MGHPVVGCSVICSTLSRLLSVGSPMEGRGVTYGTVAMLLRSLRHPVAGGVVSCDAPCSLNPSFHAPLA